MKTIEDLKIELSRSMRLAAERGEYQSAADIKRILTGIDAINTISNWIDMNIQKPKEGIKVLIQPTDNSRIVISKIVTDGELGEMWFDDSNNTFRLDTVRYWMELPNKPNNLK